MSGLQYLTDVVTLTLDREKCSGCMLCLEVCPHAVFEMREKRAAIVDRDACMECGACSQNCPDGAIEVRSGVGCAVAVLNGWRRGGDYSCGCDDGCC